MEEQTTNKTSTRSIDYWLLIFTFALVTVGLIIVFSASSVSAGASSQFNRDAFYFLKRQFIWIAIGIIAMFSVINVDLMKIRKFALPILIASIFLLVIVLIPGIGVVVSGARRWIVLGPIGFQPAEFAKLALVFYMADIIDRHKERFENWKGIIVPLCILVVMCGLVELEPDLGTTLVIAASFFCMMFLSGCPLKYIAGSMAVGMGAVVLKIFHDSYKMKRMIAFMDPLSDKYREDVCYHIRQSLIALGSGGIFGVGLGQSRQKFFYLPEQHTDFIFAILGEELGLVGTLLLIFIFLGFIYRGLKISLQANYSFYRLLGAGLTFTIGIQAFMNIGVVTSMLPTTGIPLPFISYGGTSMLFNLVCVGILLNISKHSIFTSK